MTVYVDDMRYPYRRNYGTLKLSHMFADTIEELEEMAERIGLDPKWLQTKSSLEHYDVAESKRLLAIEYGAVPISYWEDTGRVIREIRARRASH